MRSGPLLYLVLSHANPPQVARLARRLVESDDAAVLIHHDRSQAPLDRKLFAELPNVGFVERPVAVRWGRFSVVRAALCGIQTALERRIPFSWVVLLSGQDYPCMPLRRLAERLAKGRVDGYIDHEPLERRREENVSRALFRYYEVHGPFRGLTARLWRLNQLQPFLRFSSSRAGAFVGVADPRPFTPAWPCWRGSFWWTLSRACVEYVDCFVRQQPAFVSAYERKLFADESFFQSVLVNAGRFRLVNDDLRYIRWDDPLGGSPALLRASDVPAILASGKPFARKFDERVDSNVLDLLDRELERLGGAVAVGGDVRKS